MDIETTSCAYGDGILVINCKVGIRGFVCIYYGYVYSDSILMNCYQWEWEFCFIFPCKTPTNEPIELAVIRIFLHRRPYGVSISIPSDQCDLNVFTHFKMVNPCYARLHYVVTSARNKECSTENVIKNHKNTKQWIVFFLDKLTMPIIIIGADVDMTQSCKLRYILP